MLLTVIGTLPDFSSTTSPALNVPFAMVSWINVNVDRVPVSGGLGGDRKITEHAEDAATPRRRINEDVARLAPEDPPVAQASKRPVRPTAKGPAPRSTLRGN
jgi:hypothetical protein